MRRFWDHMNQQSGDDLLLIWLFVAGTVIALIVAVCVTAFQIVKVLHS